MSYKIVRLSSLLSSYGEDEVLARLSSFEPACESSNDSFLTDNAIPMEKRSECRTYIAYDSDTQAIMGFFSIGFRCLEVPDVCGLSKTMLRKLNRSYEGVAQAYLLGQLSRAKGFKGFGKTLIDEAMSRIRAAQDIVGCRVVRLDCADGLVGYYEEYGFHFVKKNADKDLNQMVMIF